MKYGIIDNLNNKKVNVSKLKKMFGELKLFDPEIIINKETEYNKNNDFQILPIDQLVNESDIIIVLGGDGSLLHTARSISGTSKPFLGVNFGKLGFLADVKDDDIIKSLQMIESGEYFIEERIMIEAEYSDGKICALNDIVIDKGFSQRVLKISVDINGKYFNTYTSDGLIISTPTGSTAYNMSANGPIVQPIVPAFIITPLSPHALAMRPVVIPDDSIISITAESSDRKMILSGDGQNNEQIEPLSKVIVKKSENVARFVKFKDRDFYMLLREKLGWGGFKQRVSK